MNFLILKRLWKVSSMMRPWFSTKFPFKWTFYRKLILKRCLDAKDWLYDKITIQHKVAFQMDFLRKVNSCFDAKFGSTMRSRFRKKFHLKLTFKNGLRLWQLKTSLIRFKNLKTLQAYSCRLYRKLEILILIRAYSLKSKECNLRMQKTSCFHCLFIFFKIILEMSWFLKNVLSLTNSSSSCKYFRKHGLFLLFILRSLQNQSSNR